MILDIYKESLNRLKNKPFKLWGIAMLSVLLSSLAVALFPIPGASIVIDWLLQTAMCMIFLKFYFYEEISVDDLFMCFKGWDKIKRVVGGIAWMCLWIFVWSLIPVAGIVFGIIRSYEYRLTPYILMNEPDVGIKEAINVSKERTNGYKAKMFFADIVWIALVGVAFLFLLLLSKIRFIGWIFGIANFALVVLVSLAGVLFQGFIQTSFYVEIEKNRSGSKYYKSPLLATITDPADIIKCKSCGEDIRTSDMFCSKCGAKQEEPKKNALQDIDVINEASATKAPETVTDAVEDSVKEINEIKEEPKKKKTSSKKAETDVELKKEKTNSGKKTTIKESEPKVEE